MYSKSIAWQPTRFVQRGFSDRFSEDAFLAGIVYPGESSERNLNVGTSRIVIRTFIIALIALAVVGCTRPLSIQEPPRIVRAGALADFPDVGVYAHIQSDGAWIVRLPDGDLIALHTFCTNDGCTTNWSLADKCFKCPCCGAEFEMTGVASRGPATQPLNRLTIFVDCDSVMVNASERLSEDQSSDSEAAIQIRDINAPG